MKVFLAAVFWKAVGAIEKSSRAGKRGWNDRLGEWRAGFLVK